MKEDQLVTTALKGTQWIQENFTKVVVGVAVLIAGVAIALFTANARRNTAEQAELELALGMNQYQTGAIPDATTTFLNLSDRYSGHRAGVVSTYFLGECYLSQKQYDDALRAYDRYLENGDNAYFTVGAMIGKAYAYEGLEKYIDAAQTLEQVLQTLSEDDPRRTDVTFRAAVFYQRADVAEEAKRLFALVAESNDGRLKPRADMWLAILE